MRRAVGADNDDAGEGLHLGCIWARTASSLSAHSRRPQAAVAHFVAKGRGATCHRPLLFLQTNVSPPGRSRTLEPGIYTADYTLHSTASGAMVIHPASTTNDAHVACVVGANTTRLQPRHARHLTPCPWQSTCVQAIQHMVSSSSINPPLLKEPLTMLSVHSHRRRSINVGMRPWHRPWHAAPSPPQSGNSRSNIDRPVRQRPCVQAPTMQGELHSAEYMCQTREVIARCAAE